MRKTRVKVVEVDGKTLYLPQIKEWGIYWRTFGRDDTALYQVYRRDDIAQWSEHYEGPMLTCREDIYNHEELAKEVLVEYDLQEGKKAKEARIRKVLRSTYFR